MITIAETLPFQKKADKLLSKEEKTELINYLAEHPNSGVLIQGAGGLRKLRWSKENKGKSGGVRVIYYYHDQWMPLYLIAIFAKNEKENISANEKSVLAKFAKQLVSLWKDK